MTDRENLIAMLVKTDTPFIADIDSVEIAQGSEYIYFIFDTHTGEAIEISLGSNHYSL